MQRIYQFSRQRNGYLELSLLSLRCQSEGTRAHEFVTLHPNYSLFRSPSNSSEKFPNLPPLTSCGSQFAHYINSSYVIEGRDNNGNLLYRKYILHKPGNVGRLFVFCLLCQWASRMTCWGILVCFCFISFVCKNCVHISKARIVWTNLTASFPPAQNGFAVVRPPGHHADPSNPM